MKEFINSLSTNDKIIVVFSMIMLAISVTELIVFAIRFWYAVIVYQKDYQTIEYQGIDISIL